MKSSLKLLLSLALISLYACNSESLQEQLEEGTWVVVSGSTTDCNDPRNNESAALNTSPCTATSGDCEYLSFMFTNSVATLTTITTDNGIVETDIETGTYAIGEDDILTLCFDGECNSGPASVDDDKATLTFLNLEDDGCTLTFNLSR